MILEYLGASFDGMQWSGQQVLSDRGTNTSPALAEFNGKLYMAWTGFAGWKEEETRNIYWSTYDGTRWSGQQRVLEYEGAEATIASPALAEFKGKLYMAWTGYFSSNVKWSTFDGTVPPKPRSPWSPQQSADSSPLGLTISPTLAEFDGRLYMTWVGPEHDPTGSIGAHLMKHDGHHNKVQIHFKPAHHQDYANTNKSSVLALVMKVFSFFIVRKIINLIRYHLHETF